MNLVRLCFSFYGRVNRAKYWIGFGIAYGMMFAILLLFIWIEPENIYLNGALGIWALVWTVALFAVAAKRLHDLDVSGWWILGFMIMVFLFNAAFAASFAQFRGVSREVQTVALAVGIIWLGSARGTEGSNRFGPDPIPRPADKGS